MSNDEVSTEQVTLPPLMKFPKPIGVDESPPTIIAKPTAEPVTSIFYQKLTGHQA